MSVPDPRTSESPPGTIWVQSNLLPNGRYVVAVHYDADRSRVLDRDEALKYAAAVHALATHAEHDAAVAAQLSQLGLPRDAVAQAVVDLRARRPAIEEAITAPLSLTPSVSASRGVGYLKLSISGRLIAQWEVADARDHANNVLTVLAAVDLDAVYRRYLVMTVGLDRNRAERVVDDLAKHIANGNRRG
ncbi:hypothetical protein [Sphaerisporangium sp. TRM90804]|uniref:hypothetical protein n=1 Tax=Sphaerisporangium sp. TRM90804 TaxID=3031113 RepID=UPI00244A258F|nr:hypothetical protein [Sphaerisporangium sp. TRM90804]MDH2425752.1 hypothetical protein [Sphaerisporangium sp. TRM90804]